MTTEIEMRAEAVVAQARDQWVADQMLEAATLAARVGLLVEAWRRADWLTAHERETMMARAGLVRAVDALHVAAGQLGGIGSEDR